MKAVIFAGGLGTRITEESIDKPKPMIEIGGRPLLWHIMTIYARHGVRDFVICLGYKGYVIKDYFFNYYRHTADITIDLRAGTHQVHSSSSEDWQVTLVDTGRDTHTGGRLKRVERYLDGETFFATYGDGLANIDVAEELAFHQRHGLAATVTAIQPPGRYGRLETDQERVTGFEEKPRGEFGWVNGGFFIFEPTVLSRLTPNSGMLEAILIPELAADRQLAAYRHNDFWMSCDTMRDKLELEAICARGRQPWLEAKHV